MSEVQILNTQHPGVQYLCHKDKRLAQLIDMVGDIEYREQPDCFARLVHSIHHKNPTHLHRTDVLSLQSCFCIRSLIVPHF